MKTYRIRITKGFGNRKQFKFNSELPMEAVQAAVRAVVKDTYNMSIKEVQGNLPEDRNLLWAVNEAAKVRFYQRVWREQTEYVPCHEKHGTIKLPKGASIEPSYALYLTFFKVVIPANWGISLDRTLCIGGSNIKIASNGYYYVQGKYTIVEREEELSVCYDFIKEGLKAVTKGEFVTEEL